MAHQTKHILTILAVTGVLLILLVPVFPKKYANTSSEYNTLLWSRNKAEKEIPEKEGVSLEYSTHYYILGHKIFDNTEYPEIS